MEARTHLSVPACWQTTAESGGSPPAAPRRGGPETGDAIAYPVNAKGSLREIHAAQEGLEAGVGAEDISLARDSVVDHVEPGGDAVHDCPEDRLV